MQYEQLTDERADYEQAKELADEGALAMGNDAGEVQRLRALAQRVANLNPDAGEIGEGMLRSLVDEARGILGGE